MAKGNRPATSSAEDSLPLGDAPKDLELALEPQVATPEELATEAARIEAERLASTSSPLGPRVKVHPHGSIHWDSATYKANEEFQVDTSKHKEADFLELLANGTLLRAE